MTIDYQRWDNIHSTRDFLRYLCGFPDHDVFSRRIPAPVRERAMQLLKHFPEEWWVEEMRKRAKSDAG